MKLFKKTAIVILFTIMFFLITKENVYAYTGTIKTDTLKLRKSPSTDSIVLELMSIGEDIEVLEKEGEWYKVVYKGIKGYAHKDYIEVKEEENNSHTEEKPSEEVTPPVEEEKPEHIEQEPETKPQSSSGKMATNTHLKILPLLQSATIVELSTEDTIEVMAKAGDWAYVSNKGINGWVIESNIEYSEVTTPNEITKPNKESDVETSNEKSQEKESENEEKPKETENQVKEPVYEPKQAYVNSESINVRQAPSMGADVITTLVINTEVTIVGEENGFYKIEFKERTGYVAERLLSDKKTEVTSRGEVDRTVSNKEVTEQKDTNLEKTEENVLEKNKTSSKGEEVVKLAKSYLGYPYIYGGNSPTSGFDCSGYTQYIFKQFNVSLSHSATAQSNKGTYVERANLQLGDIVIFNNDANTSIGHVGIYIGENNFIHASNPSDGVKITSLSSSYYAKRYVTARRLV